MLVASASIVGFGFRSGKLERVNVFRFAPESGHPICAVNASLLAATPSV